MNTLEYIKNSFLKKMVFSILSISYLLVSTEVLARMTEHGFFEFNRETPCYRLFSEKIDVYFPYYEKEVIGNHNAYRMDFPSSEKDYAISSSTYYIKEDVSKVFWKEILFFSSHVMSIYNERKVHLGRKFLKKWGKDIKQNKYNSFLVKVFSDKSSKILGTVRFIASNVLHTLPLEKFLGIRLNDSSFERYEIGLLTVDKNLPIEERYRVHLELWINLVSFFKERSQKEVKVYAFSDGFGTRMYTSWGFTPVESYYKDGKKLSISSKGYKKGLQLDNKVQMGVLEYVLSKESLEELLYHISGGKYNLKSELVVNRLKSLDLYDVFEKEDENLQIISNISDFINLIFSPELYNNFDSSN